MNELITAVKDKKLVTVQALIAGGADLNVEDKNGCKALWWACRKGYTEIAKLLKDAGARII